jgi:hypothetical protein
VLKLYILIFFLYPSTVQPQVSTVIFNKGVNKQVVKDWSDSLLKRATVDSTTYITKKAGGKDKLHRVGHRDIVIWIPYMTDLSKKFTVVLWFHGHRGYASRKTFQNRILKQFIPYVGLKNFVVVIPELPWSIHTKTPTARNGKVWSQSGDFMEFISQTRKVLTMHAALARLGEVDYKVVGHSAGGSVIKRVSLTGDLCKINLSMVVWSDSTYGEWLKDAWSGCLGSVKVPTEVFVRKFGPPWKNALKFMKEPKSYPEFLHLHVKQKPWTHKLIGNSIVKLSGVLD